MHLRQPGFTYSARETFRKNKERIQKFKETGSSQYIYPNELDKACVQQTSEYLLITYYVIKHLILIKTQNTMDFNVELF